MKQEYTRLICVVCSKVLNSIEESDQNPGAPDSLPKTVNARNAFLGIMGINDGDLWYTVNTVGLDARETDLRCCSKVCLSKVAEIKTPSDYHGKSTITRYTCDVCREVRERDSSNLPIGGGPIFSGWYHISMTRHSTFHQPNQRRDEWDACSKKCFDNLHKVIEKYDLALDQKIRGAVDQDDD